ncbi:MAG TPA: hypothetical protein EYQ18_23200 [Candidatus Handelsmanbacteria bacterium]|nr:hypothetical protein [Candidatus Handelsmanbacteria bacterium]
MRACINTAGFRSPVEAVWRLGAVNFPALTVIGSKIDPVALGQSHHIRTAQAHKPPAQPHPLAGFFPPAQAVG